MKFSIGDKIVLKRTNEEGTVVAYLSGDMLEVEVEGVHFPVYADEVDHPYLKWFTEKKRTQKKASLPEQLPVEKQPTTKRLSKGVYLSFMPVFKTQEMEDIVAQLKVFLINETASAIRFSYNARFALQSDFSLKGTLHAFGHVYLHTIDYERMNDQPKFHWELAAANDSTLKTEEGILRLKPSKLFKHITDLLLKNEPAFSCLLVEDFVVKPVVKGENFVPPSKPVRTSKPSKIHSLSELPRYEVDLHIEQLEPDYKGLSNADIMNIQLHMLQRYLHLAIIHRMEKMMVIHGIGTGALREAVHKILAQTPEVKNFKNEYIGKYGFGATEVVFYV